MSLGWKRFSFFDQQERPGAAVPEATTCCAGSAAHVFFGCASGEVVALDSGLARLAAWQAHQHCVDGLSYQEGRGVLLTLGRDDASALALTAKVWDMARLAPGAAPALLRSAKVAASPPKQGEGLPSAFAVHSGPGRTLTVAVGTPQGLVHVLRGEFGKDRLQRSLLSLRRQEDAPEAVTGLVFTGEGSELVLFALTPSQTIAWDLTTLKKAVLDEAGAEPHGATRSGGGDLVVGRPEAAYFYTPEGRGPCFALEGRKDHVAWLGGYFGAVLEGRAPGPGPGTSRALHLYELRSKLIVATLPLAEGCRHVVEALGGVLAVEPGGRVTSLVEKPLGARLDLLYAKSLFLAAANQAEAAGAEAGVLAETRRRFGDHLYAKHDYEGATAQYAATIGHLEPSYVVRRFLDAQRIHGLTAYLEALHARGHAGADHTTLLLNCYAKLKDEAKLGAFLQATGTAGPGEGGAPVLPFDAETAVKVCRAGGYTRHALTVAAAAREPGWTLDILLEDCGAWDEALAFLRSLPRQEAARALHRHGKALVEGRPEATTALLMQLCTVSDGAKPDGDWVAKVTDFAHLFTDRPQALTLLCEYVLNSTQTPPSEGPLYLTLLQLYLAPAPVPPPPGGLPEGGTGAEQGSGREAASGSSASAAPAGHHQQQQQQQQQRAAREEQALELLRRGWPAGAEEPRYDAERALVACRLAGFRPGLVFLYESLRLFREVLQVHMAAHDDAALIEAGARLSSAARGGDPALWTELLDYFGRRGADCTPQVLEVLGHIEAGNLVHPAVVLQALAANPHLRLEVVKGYLTRVLAAEGAVAGKDRRVAAQHAAETAAMRAECAALLTQARVFQASRCAATGAPLELPAVHFYCGHSFSARALGENERECPLCAPQFRTILDIQQSLRSGAAEQDKFYKQLENSTDGFNVIAEYFGRGLLDAPAAAAA